MKIDTGSKYRKAIMARPHVAMGRDKKLSPAQTKALAIVAAGNAHTYTFPSNMHRSLRSLIRHHLVVRHAGGALTLA